jgi:hypothetical protein
MTINSSDFPKTIGTEEKHEELNGWQNYDTISTV